MASCPCELVTPCSDMCTCAFPFMSGGCGRCCKYGSAEQQLLAAKVLAACTCKTTPFDFEILRCTECKHDYRDHYYTKDEYTEQWSHGTFYCQKCDCKTCNTGVSK